MHCDVTSIMIFAYIVQSEISQVKSKIINFYKRNNQPILRYLYTEAIKRRGKFRCIDALKQNATKER